MKKKKRNKQTNGKITVIKLWSMRNWEREWASEKERFDYDDDDGAIECDTPFYVIAPIAASVGGGGIDCRKFQVKFKKKMRLVYGWL